MMARAMAVRVPVGLADMRVRAMVMEMVMLMRMRRRRRRRILGLLWVWAWEMEWGWGWEWLRRRSRWAPVTKIFKFSLCLDSGELGGLGVRWACSLIAWFISYYSTFILPDFLVHTAMFVFSFFGMRSRGV